jgi:uncharacterized RDD family membrane protein YckC
MISSNDNIAGLGKRTLAVIIDVFVSIVIIYIISNVFLKPFGGLTGAMGLKDYQFGEDIVKGAFSGLGAIFVLFLASMGALFIVFLYDFLMVVFMQATVGKYLMKIKVISSDGTSLGVFKAFFRSFLKFTSGYFCFLPWLIAIFTDKKQATHDLLVGSIVVKNS